MTLITVKEDWKDTKFKDHSKKKSVCLSRYGGFGDALQTAAVIKSFKDDGWFVSVNATEATHDILRNDPNIDEFIIQKTDQIPSTELGGYWNHISQFYERFVVFSESVEGSLIALPHRVQHTWSAIARHKYMNHNYVEMMHDIAGVPYRHMDMTFYPNSKETKWAQDYRNKLGKKNKIILYPLSGSSFHKVYPYMDALIAQLMVDYTDVKLVLVGDNACVILEQGWEKEPRVLRKSGKWGIRETLAFAKHADIVIGPETGVLNAVAAEDNHKVVFLSHSSANNLTRDWTNTIALEPTCACHPCHKLHYSTDTCELDDELNMAKCTMIDPAIAYKALTTVIGELNEESKVQQSGHEKGLQSSQAA